MKYLKNKKRGYIDRAIQFTEDNLPEIEIFWNVVGSPGTIIDVDGDQLLLKYFRTIKGFASPGDWIVENRNSLEWICVLSDREKNELYREVEIRQK